MIKFAIIFHLEADTGSNPYNLADTALKCDPRVFLYLVKHYSRVLFYLVKYYSRVLFYLVKFYSSVLFTW